MEWSLTVPTIPIHLHLVPLPLTHAIMGFTCKASSLLKYVVGIRSLRIGTGHLPLAQVIEFLSTLVYNFSHRFANCMHLNSNQRHSRFIQAFKFTSVINPSEKDRMLLTLMFFFLIAITCEQLNAPTNGFITFAIDTIAPYDYLTTATYGCNTAYGLSGGNTVRTCVGSSTGPGEWNGVAPDCEGKNNDNQIIM